MAGGAACATMADMPATHELTRRALIEVAAPHHTVQNDPVVRRYRLARVSLFTRPDPAQDRFAHLRRSYD